MDKIKSLLKVSGSLNMMSQIIRTGIDEKHPNLDNKYDNVGELIIEYIGFFVENGGINMFDFKSSNSISTDCAHLHIVANTKIDDDFIINVKKNMIKVAVAQNLLPNKEVGNTTLGEIFKQPTTLLGTKNYNYGGDICSMVIYLGLLYDDIDELFAMAIKISKIAHNNIIGMLFAITSVYFSMLAVKNVEIEKWVFKLIDILQSVHVKKYIDFNNNEEFNQYIRYLRPWQKYTDDKFKNGKVISHNASYNLIYRVKFYVQSVFPYNDKTTIGYDGMSCLIVAYNTLLDGKDNFEKIVYYGMLLPTVTPNIMTIVGSLYYLMYGDKNIPKYILKHYDDTKKYETILKEMRN